MPSEIFQSILPDYASDAATVIEFFVFEKLKITPAGEAWMFEPAIGLDNRPPIGPFSPRQELGLSSIISRAWNIGSILSASTAPTGS